MSNIDKATTMVHIIHLGLMKSKPSTGQNLKTQSHKQLRAPIMINQIIKCIIAQME